MGGETKGTKGERVIAVLGCRHGIESKLKSVTTVTDPAALLLAGLLARHRNNVVRLDWLSVIGCYKDIAR